MFCANVGVSGAGNDGIALYTCLYRILFCAGGFFLAETNFESVSEFIKKKKFFSL